MRTVTIVALCRLRVSELGDLPVVGLEVRLGNIRVAPSTLRHDLKLEPLQIGAPDRMGCVTLAADGQRLFGLAHFCRMDALHELPLNTMMAATACRSDVIAVYA